MKIKSRATGKDFLIDFYEKKAKKLNINPLTFYYVGVTRFELATTRPPDAYSKPG